MKTIALVLFCTALLLFLLYGCSEQHKKKADNSQIITRYLATYSLPCGRSVLTLEMGDKKTETVSVTGDNNPLLELNPFVLSNTTLNVSGYFNGKNKNDPHCGSYPEFVVTEYQAAGPVSRCTTYGDIYMSELLILFPQDLPKNTFAPIDYRKNTGMLKTTSSDNCRKTPKNSRCASNETSANSCDLQEFWCCINK